MNEHAEPVSDTKLLATCIEEQIIAASKSIYRPLPMMEELFAQLEEPLALALSDYTSTKSEVALKSFEYLSCAEALKSCPTPSLFGVVNAKPWDGVLAVIAESNLIITMLQTMLGGQPSSKSQKRKTFTGIEKRIAIKLYEVALRELSRKFADVTEVKFQVDTLEADIEELNLAPMDSSCVKITVEVLLEGQGGQMTFIIPYIAFEAAEQAFSQPFRGGGINGEKGWRTAMAKSLQDTDIQLTAILQEMTVPLHEVLAWRPGQVLDIGVDTEHELLVECSNKKMFRAAMGCRKNGSVALRISKTLNELES